MAETAANTAAAEFSSILDRVAGGKERVIVHRDGKPAAAVIPMGDLELFERLIEEEEDRIDISEARRILNDPTEVPIPLSEVLAEEGLLLDGDNP